MILRPPRSTLFPTRRSSDLLNTVCDLHVKVAEAGEVLAAHTVYLAPDGRDRKSTRLNSSHANISYAVFCLKKKKKKKKMNQLKYKSTIKDKTHPDLYNV